MIVIKLNNIFLTYVYHFQTSDLAHRILRHSSRVIGLGKETFYKQIKEHRDDAYW